MSKFARSFDSSKFNMETDSFDEERDTARAIFYYDDALDSKGDLVRVEMVKIQSPGEALNVYGGKVREEDKYRFAKAYEAFKRGETLLDGTPLTEWPEVSGKIDFMSQLRGFGFQTVEDMANMQDGAQRLFHGSLTWKKKAQRFLEQQDKIKTAQKLEADESAKDQELTTLKERLASLEATIAEANKPKRRGRPPKNPA